MTDSAFKDKNRKNVCTSCPKRLACYDLNSICELVTPCDVCEIKSTCVELCAQMDAYLQRGNKREFRIGQVSEEDKILLLPSIDEPSKPTTKSILWELLEQKDKQLLQDHFIKGRSQEDIAKELGVSKQSISSRIYGNATKRGLLYKLKVFHKFRELVLEYFDLLPDKYRDVLIERYVKFKKPGDLVTVGRPLPMVYRWLQRGRQLLVKLEKEAKDGKISTNSKVYRLVIKNKNGPGKP